MSMYSNHCLYPLVNRKSKYMNVYISPHTTYIFYLMAVAIKNRGLSLYRTLTAVNSGCNTS